MKQMLLLSILLTCQVTGYAQYVNKEIKSNNGQPYLVGHILPQVLEQEPYNSWFHKEYKAYEPDTTGIKEIKEELKTYHILVFLGTWCGDSKREIPRFLKILKEAQFPMEQLKMVALDKAPETYKKSPTGEEWGLQIKRVPTFLFLKDGVEQNRIIERPNIGLEADIKAIVKEMGYVPNTARSRHFD